MAQFLRPDSDVVTTANWTTTPYWSNLDETTASDSDFITCANNANDTIEIGLSDANTPQSGTRTLRIRCRKGAAAGNTRGLDYNLKENGTSVQSGTVNAALSEVYSTINITITNSITNYSLLTLELTSTGTTGGAGGNRRTVEVSWVEFEIPDLQNFTYDESVTLSINITDNNTNNLQYSDQITLSTNFVDTYNGNLIYNDTINLGFNVTTEQTPTYIFNNDVNLSFNTTLETTNSKENVFIIKNSTDNTLFMRSNKILTIRVKK